MKNRLRFAIIVVALAALACSPLGGGGGAGPILAQASPTPPPIPTRPLLTPTGGPTPTPTAEATVPSGQAVSIIYGSLRGTNPGLYYLSADGQFMAPINLGQDHPYTMWPDVSPDGSKIAFVSTTSSLQIIGIFVQDHTDGSIFQVTQGDGTHPKWSPDGSRIAYTCNSGTDVCVTNLNGTEQANLTADSERIEMYPDWTPDGRIVFMSNRDVSDRGMFSEIYIMNPDGTGVTRLTNDDKYYNAYPSVSPDGTRIAYESNRDGGPASEIYIMNTDGSDQVRITNDSVWNQNPVWTPDGQQIMFAMRGSDGNIDLYTVNLDGSNKFRLTQDINEDGGLRLGHTWLPSPIAVEDLKHENVPTVTVDPPRGTSAVSNGILFAASNFNCPDCLETGIYFVTFDGANKQRMPTDGFFPAWAPDFKRYAYVQNGEMYIANADGSEPTQMTHAYMGLSSLDWSEDGNTILADCLPYGQHDACLIDTSTGAINNITESIVFGSGVAYPVWISADRILIGAVVLDPLGVQVGSAGLAGNPSPDGTRMAGIKKKQLYVMNFPDASNQTQLTTDASTKGFPIWSPDGTLIIYMAAPGDGRLYLWATRADGVNPPYQLVALPIAIGPTERPDVIDIWYGYGWAP